ncbi:extracellular solute-binding protein [Marinisporobacter balticus]|uniref:Iron(III) transport system substrate-binding protein n=1 Tax=Marinisporobacter balticus TaxID=2018667 RepID=A0A4R2L1G1_9FIRM|nr:extracellular solute-binding protein [Marinisporobacter balticus]TCO79432.1 iron(III) transport system substrate-binding protein [Marinisporobacter balticus]
MDLKRIVSIILILLFVFSLAACTSGKSTENENMQAEEQNAREKEVELEEKVVIYSTHPEALLEYVATEFEKETGVKVEFLNFKGELPDRVRAEKANPQADVMYGAASSVFIELKKEDLFDQYVPTWAEGLKPLFKDSEGYWFGTMQTPVMLFYNNEVLSEEQAPEDWLDLIKPEYKDQLVFRNALSSSARATFASLLYQFSKEEKIDDGWKYMSDLDMNTKKYYGSGSLQFQAIGRKEAAISYAPLNAIVDNKVKNNLPLTIIDAQSGSPVITDSIAMIKGAKNPNAAKGFIEFAGRPDIQAKLANEFNRMPTHPEAIKNSPDWMKEKEYKVMDVDWAVLSEKQSEWMQKWDTEIKDAKKDEK